MSLLWGVSFWLSSSTSFRQGDTLGKSPFRELHADTIVQIQGSLKSCGLLTLYRRSAGLPPTPTPGGLGDGDGGRASAADRGQIPDLLGRSNLLYTMADAPKDTAPDGEANKGAFGTQKRFKWKVTPSGSYTAGVPADSSKRPGE